MIVSDVPRLHPRLAADAAWEAQRQTRLEAEADEERAREVNGYADDPSIEPSPPPPSPLEFVVGSSLASRKPVERPWLVTDWIPRRQVTLLTGDGGVGKTILAMQLMIGAAATGAWLGLPVMRCRAFGLFAEDDDDEIDRRMRGAAQMLGAEIPTLDDLAWRSAVVDPCELVEVGVDGRIRATKYFDRLRATILAVGARLVVLDAATNLYGGDELRRRQVNAFITLLRRLAIDIDGSVVLLAHPSAHGISTGSGISGSTHWNNSVRSRLYFEGVTGDDADPDERTLRCSKANYARSGAVLRVRWNDGGFVELDPPGSLDRAAMSTKAERVFLSLLSATYNDGSWVSVNLTARNYVPAVFSKHPDREGLSKIAFEAAMRRLLKTGQVKTETYGRPSEPRTRLAPT